jgi:hypothetical protein
VNVPHWDSVAEEYVARDLSTSVASWSATALSLRNDADGKRPDNGAEYRNPPVHVELHITVKRTEVAWPPGGADSCSLLSRSGEVTLDDPGSAFRRARRRVGRPPDRPVTDAELNDNQWVTGLAQAPG